MSEATFPPELLAATDDAQRRAIAVARRTQAALAEGMMPADVEALLRSGATEAGFTAWFHPPQVRFGGPVRPGLRAAPKPLRRGTLVELDLGPANAHAAADFGTAFVFGASGPEPAVLSQARALLRASAGFASRWKCAGEVYVYADAWARNRNASLGGAGDVGHVLFGPVGRTAPLWPHLARAAIRMRRHQLHWFNHRRMHGLYAVRPRFVQAGHGCAFEEVILIDGDTRRPIGRDSWDELGTL